jgi:hypothetical protein
MESDMPSAARRTLQGGRVAVVWAVVVFVACQAVLSVLIETNLPELRDPPYWVKHRRLRQRLAEAHGHPVTVVMLGSSRTAYGLHGQLLERALTTVHGRPAVVFNLGVFGAGPVAERLYLRRLLDDGIRPGLLLVEVMPALLHGDDPPGEVFQLPAHRLQWRDVPLVERYAGSAARGLARDWWWSELLPVRAHGEAAVAGLVPRLLNPHTQPMWWKEMDGCGWVSLTQPSFVAREGRERTLNHCRQLWGPQLARLRHGGPACRALEDLVVTARGEGITTALVVMPEGPAMRSWYNPDGWRNLRAYLEGLERQFGCCLVDAREWMAEEEFADSHHLIAAGARRFSERLGREAVLPLLGHHTSQRANASVRDLTASAGRRGMNSCPR